MDGEGLRGTALNAALLRAAHRMLDEPPHIFADDYALPLCGRADVKDFCTRLTALQTEAARVVGPTYAAAVLRAVRAAILVWSR